MPVTALWPSVVTRSSSTLPLRHRVAQQPPQTAHHIQPGAWNTHYPLTDWLTYDFSSTWRYSKDLRWLLCATHSWHFEKKKKKTQAEAQAPGLSVSRCPHLGNNITYEEMRDKELRLFVKAVHCLAAWELANATGKVTGHFHLDPHINPPLSGAVNNTQPALPRNKKRRKKMYFVLTTPPCPFTATGLVQPSALFIT